MKRLDQMNAMELKKAVQNAIEQQEVWYYLNSFLSPYQWSPVRLLYLSPRDDWGREEFTYQLFDTGEEKESRLASLATLFAQTQEEVRYKEALSFKKRIEDFLILLQRDGWPSTPEIQECYHQVLALAKHVNSFTKQS